MQARASLEFDTVLAGLRRYVEFVQAKQLNPSLFGAQAAKAPAERMAMYQRDVEFFSGTLTRWFTSAYAELAQRMRNSEDVTAAYTLLQYPCIGEHKPGLFYTVVRSNNMTTLLPVTATFSSDHNRELALLLHAVSYFFWRVEALVRRVRDDGHDLFHDNGPVNGLLRGIATVLCRYAPGPAPAVRPAHPALPPRPAERD